LRPEEAQDADIWFHHWMLHQLDDGSLQSSFDVDQENDTIAHIRSNLLSHADAGYLSLAIQIAQILERRLETTLMMDTHLDLHITLQS
jgi:hypothetical protein